MNIAQAKQIDLPALLNKLGIREELRPGRQGLWFYSPFRDEDTASFKIWQQGSGLWCWKDFGSGQGGNVIAFANCMLGRDPGDQAVSGALQWLEKSNGGRVANDPKPRIQTPATPQIEPIKQDRYTLIDNRKLTNPQLCNYLRDRNIHPHYAQMYCGQANYLDTVSKKKFYGISFPNIDGGLEIRAASQYKYYANTGPKNFSYIPGQDKTATKIALFEGFIDFLSYLVLTVENRLPQPAIVLNSVSFIGRAAEFIERQSPQTRLIQTYFDHDEAGQKAYDALYATLGNKDFTVADERYLYEGYHDLNAFLKDAPTVDRGRFKPSPPQAKIYDTSASAEARRHQETLNKLTPPKL